MTNFSVVTVDDRMLYFTSAATISHISEVILNEIKERMGKRKGRKCVCDEDTK
jgi:hypothetical protein